MAASLTTISHHRMFQLYTTSARKQAILLMRSEEHTSELQSRFDLVPLHPFPTRRSSDLVSESPSLLHASPHDLTNVLNINITSQLQVMQACHNLLVNGSVTDNDQSPPYVSAVYNISSKAGNLAHEIGRAHV